MTRTDATPRPGGLDFDTDPGSHRSKWIAGLLALCLIGWMGSGYIFPAPPPPGEDEEVDAKVTAVSVAVRDSRAEEVSRIFSAEGRAEPDRRLALRPEAGGEVARITARKGEILSRGDVIAEISSRELEARLTEAKEAFQRAQRELENAETLLERGVATLDRVTDARADRATAEAALTSAEEALAASIIRAPFSGRLHTLDLDHGSVISAGEEIGIMLDTDPLEIVIQVPQQSRARISEGQDAQVSFITGTETTGRVSYVSSDATAETRTFRAEITIPNPGGSIPSGLSARVDIPTGDLEAHFISPAILSLDTSGRLGVKTVDEDNRVVFTEVKIERAETSGIWVSGLPEVARIITVGQGFVREGEIVAPRVDDTRTEDIAANSRSEVMQ